jgi:LysR family glycine cleavage system transcriptional activator
MIMKIANSRISLRGLRTFCTVAEQGSFRGAAETLFLTPSAISHQIKRLEGELDVKLFDRDKRLLQLTDAGEALFHESAPLITQLDQVARKFHARYCQRTLRVTVQPFFATELLVPQLSSFIAENPGITISLDTEDQSTEKHPSQADVSIRLFRKAPEHLAADELFKLRLVPACSPDFHTRTDWPADGSLDTVPLIVHTRRPNAWRDWGQAAGMSPGRYSSLIRLETMISVARAAEQGLGVALVPLPLSESWFDTGRLVRLSACELHTRDRYLMVTRPEDTGRPEVRAFRQWILGKFVPGS